jgi:hypothetical protein
MQGTVVESDSSPATLLRINGIAGDVEREIHIATGVPFQVTMAACPGESTSAFALYGHIGTANVDTVSHQPGSIGDAAIPTPLSGGSPRMVVVANNLGPRSTYGTPVLHRWVPPAPTLCFEKRLGVFAPAIVSFQALVSNPSASNDDHLSLSNAMILRIP